ncbi:MAG: FtsW/RodA/SpoVE family cell cycle protein, partial [Lachnospiraceae bacterium]|nr:FtsW/RodA/SpoVE family cell cycle protein [Lachnospiraceae bacterium]
YAVQTILTIGGAIKFIPSTGVTLPLISYGGSSVLCTMIMFAIFQGLVVHAAYEEKQASDRMMTEDFTFVGDTESLKAVKKSSRNKKKKRNI